MERIITKSFARLMGRGTHRGFITYEELSKSLGKRNLSDENLSQAFIHILDGNITLVEKKSDYKVLRKKESSSKEEGKTIEKSDDPIRMYLREMGGVELLSREGEIAIAKRIEAGKDVMLIALSQSPITAQQFSEWNEKLQKDEILVREIIDIDTNYTEADDTNESNKEKKVDSDNNEGSYAVPVYVYRKPNYSSYGLSPILDADDYSIEFAVNKDGSFDKHNFKSKLGWMLGFTEVSYTIPSNGEIVAERISNLTRPRVLYLHVDDFAQTKQNSFSTMMSRSRNSDNIIAKIMVDRSSNDFRKIFFANKANGYLLSDKREYSGKTNIKRLQVQLVDEFDQKINLNGLDFSFSLKIEHL